MIQDENKIMEFIKKNFQVEHTRININTQTTTLTKDNNKFCNTDTVQKIINNKNSKAPGYDYITYSYNT